MTAARKRQRAEYVVRNWSPLLTEVHKAGHVRQCRTAVVAGSVLQWGPAANRFGTEQQVIEQTQVHGWWLPARFEIHSKQAAFIVDVDLVAHTTPTEHERQLRRYRKARNVRDLAAPATWSRLLVYDADGSTVLAGGLLTARYNTHVTRVTVVPLPQQPGRRGQQAVVGSVPIVVNDLLRAALDVAVIHGTLRPGRKVREIGQLTATVHKAASGRAVRGMRTVRSDEYLAQVRDVHQAAPQGAKTQAVQAHFGLQLSNARKAIAQSQTRLGWGLAHERSKGSPKKRTKGKKK